MAKVSVTVPVYELRDMRMIDLYTSNASEHERRATERVARATRAVFGTVAGQCYPAAEALYHLLGGKEAGLKPVVWRYADMRADGSVHGFPTHWFLGRADGSVGRFLTTVLDPTAAQFGGSVTLGHYRCGRGCGFLTREPSKRARLILDRLEDEQAVGA